MRVKIKESEEDKVYFESMYGIGIAKWNGYKPVSSQEIHVEIDINKILTFGEEVKLVDDFTAHISNCNGVCIIVGQIESVDEDDYVTIRIGENILCCVIEGVKEFVGKSIEIKTTFLEISNINY